LALEQIVAPILDDCIMDTKSDFIEELFSILAILLQQNDEISEELWFYYFLIVFSALEQNNIDDHAALPGLAVKDGFSERQRRLLEASKQLNTIDYLEYVLPALQNFILKGQDVIY